MFYSVVSYVIITERAFDNMVQEVTYGYCCVYRRTAWYAVQQAAGQQRCRCLPGLAEQLSIEAVDEPVF